MNDRIHETTMVMNPSINVRGVAFLTNMNGKAPTMRVMMKLIVSGPKAESCPLKIDTSIDMNMNKALTNRALPTFVDMAFTFILKIDFSFFPKFSDSLLEFYVLIYKFCHTVVDFSKLIITVKGIGMSSSGSPVVDDTF